MQCQCCSRELSLMRRVKLRTFPIGLNEFPTPAGPITDDYVKNDPEYLTYVAATTYRWAVICEACYKRLDDEAVPGADEINGQMFGIAGSSRGDKARIINEAQYLKLQAKT